MHSWVFLHLAQFRDESAGVVPWLVAAGSVGFALWALRGKSRASAAGDAGVPPKVETSAQERVLSEISLGSLADYSTGSMVDSALLIESERRYRQLFHLSPEALAVISADTGTVLAANEAFGKLLLGSHSEFEGFPFTDFVGEQSGSASHDMIRQGTGIPVTLTLRRRDTQTIRCETSSTKLAFQGVPAYLVVLRDITAQEQAQQNARTREAMLAALAAAGEDLVAENDWLEALKRSLPLFMRSADLSGIYLFRKQEDGEIQTLCVSGESDLRTIDAVKNHLFDDQCWIDLQERRSIRNEIVVRPGAEPLRIEAESIVVESDVVGVLCFTRHENGRLFGKAEGDSLRGLVELVASAIERAESLEAVRRSEGQIRLAQKMEAVGQLAGGISHDFNNLLTALHGYITLAKGSLPMNHPASHSLEQVELAARQAGGVANALLAFTRRSTGDRKITQISAVLDPALRMVRRSVPKNVDFNLRQEEDSPWINCDASQIQQVIIALCLNACDAMPNGGKIDISVDADDDKVKINVVDNGEGMRQDVLERLFEPFFTTKSKPEAAGLGLAIAHSIVTGHDGDIQVSSQLGRGSRFSIVLPRVPAPLIQGAPKGAHISKGAALVIDDNQFVGALICTAMANERYSPVRVTTLEDATRELAQPVAFLVVDVTLPDGNGMNWVEQRRKSGLRAPTIFITGDSTLTIDDRPDFKPAIMLHKPFKMEDLVRAMRTLEEQALTGAKS